MATVIALSTQRSVASLFESRRASIDANAERRFVEFLSCARESVDVAAYDLRSIATLETLVRLARRVKVRIIIDGGKAGRSDDPAIDPKPATTREAVFDAGLGAVTTVLHAAGDGVMHHKFAIRDGESVWTGSMNFTDGGFHLQDSGAIVFDSSDVAAAYTAEFNRMLAGTSVEATPAPEEMTVGKLNRVLPLFGARGRDAMLEMLLAARVRRVRLMAYAVTDEAILDALLRFRGADFDIKGVFDPHGMHAAMSVTAAGDDRYWFMTDPRFIAAPSDRFHHYGESNAMAHKSLIVNDTVFIGSYAFARDAGSRDENVVRVQSVQVSTAFTRYFDTLTGRYRTDEESLARRIASEAKQRLDAESKPKD